MPILEALSVPNMNKGERLAPHCKKISNNKILVIQALSPIREQIWPVKEG